MENHWLSLIIVVLASVIFLLLLIIKNNKDKQNLDKKLPGDYPDPKEVKSEFDK
jgi:hypothetical protein